MDEDKVSHIVNNYDGGAWSTNALAKHHNISPSSVINVLKANKIPRKRTGYKRIIDQHGYVKVMVSDSDAIGKSMSTKNRYVQEHRLIMAHHIGRPLLDSETVHHINGDRSDNHIDNLQLRSGNHGKGVALACHDCGSRNVSAIML